MLTYSLDEKSNISLYEQLYNYIKQDILSGTLSENTRLPSKRSIANQMSISVITVENAYNQLLSEGFIYSLPRKGFYVSELGDEYMHVTTINKQQEQKPIDEIIKSKTVTSKNSDIIDFASNATDSDTFPFSTWAKLTRRILSDDQELLLTNAPSNGLIELRSAIAEYLHEFRGIDVNPDNIVIGAGTETMYSLLIQLLGHESGTTSQDQPGKKASDKCISESDPGGCKSEFPSELSCISDEYYG